MNNLGVEQPDSTTIGTIVTEVVLVVIAGVLWWFVRDTEFEKSPFFPWIVVLFPIIALGVPLALTIRNRKRKANLSVQSTPTRADGAAGRD